MVTAYRYGSRVKVIDSAVSVHGRMMENSEQEEEQEEQEEEQEQERFRQSVQRARGKVEEYANCNDWQVFGTFTLSPDKWPRDDLPQFKRRLSQMIKDVKKKTGESLPYLLVPELHADGRAWHMHGLLVIPETELERITEAHVKTGPPSACGGDQGGDPIAGGGPVQSARMRVWVDQDGQRISRKQGIRVKQGRAVYRWPRYEKTFGYCLLEGVQSREGAAAYICKYLSKEAYSTSRAVERGKHLYLASRGLKGRERIAPEDVTAVLRGMSPGREYKYEYCTIRWYNNK